MSAVVWFVNTETGQEWAVSNPDMIDRLDKNVEFKRIDKTSKSKKAKVAEDVAEALAEGIKKAVKDAEETSAK